MGDLYVSSRPIHGRQISAKVLSSSGYATTSVITGQNIAVRGSGSISVASDSHKLLLSLRYV